MDPLSFTASLFTVIGTIGVIGNGLKKLIALKHAPRILHALNDEMASFYCVVQAVDFLVQQHIQIINTVPMSNVCRALDKSTITLLELDDLVRNKLTVETVGGERRLDRSVWLFAATRVQRVKDQIRADRLDLSAALSLLASSASLGVELQLQQMSFTLQTLGDRVLLAGAALSNQVQDLEHHKRDVQELNDNQTREPQHAGSSKDNREPSETYSEMVVAQVKSRPTPPKTCRDHSSDDDLNQPSSASNMRLSRQSTLVDSNETEPPQVLRKIRHHSLPTKLSRNACNLDCSCSCHRRNRLKTPDVLSTVFGSIIVGYKTSPWSLQACDKKSCQSRATKITYAFPQWLLRRAISVSMAYSRPQGPEFCLRMMRVRPGDADIFTAVFRGTRNHVQRLLDDNDASVLDVDPAHNTALHWAIRGMDLPMIEILINAGSDLFYENSAGSFPYSEAWEKILGEPHKYRQEELDALSFLFADRSELNYFHFSELHRACLGLSGRTFADVLVFTTKSAIDVVDNTGRTALSWAAQRGDEIAVQELLKRNADPNRLDHALKTPLHWSIAAESPACMVLLLQNDANIDAKDGYGRTAMSRVSSGRSEPSFLEALLGFRADVEIEDDEGWRPLHWAAHKNQPGNIALLLKYGADSDSTDKIGRNPLHAAMLRNCHEAINTLLDNGAFGVPGRTALGSTTLHIAAKYGDIETLRILQSPDLGDINIMEKNTLGKTAQDIAESRRDDNKEWAKSTCQEQDLHPVDWYKTWETFMQQFIHRPRKRKEGASCGESESIRNNQHFESDSSDWENIEEEDGKEIWEDAMESSNGSCNLGCVARES